ncbi:unnamed protein product [Penicillium camemberti]|uniref:Str. FM013 n=1 Tax=Penicillium camemberti (strain FM 013) TaxID=1429867 RepID=A0A0G4PJA1_PENC3|nr:unnamed protein product [Penicillium camemberti]
MSQAGISCSHRQLSDPWTRGPVDPPWTINPNRQKKKKEEEDVIPSSTSPRWPSDRELWF